MKKETFLKLDTMFKKKQINIETINYEKLFLLSEEQIDILLNLKYIDSFILNNYLNIINDNSTEHIKFIDELATNKQDIYQIIKLLNQKTILNNINLFNILEIILNSKNKNNIDIVCNELLKDNDVLDSDYLFDLIKIIINSKGIEQSLCACNVVLYNANNITDEIIFLTKIIATSSNKTISYSINNLAMFYNFNNLKLINKYARILNSFKDEKSIKYVEQLLENEKVFNSLKTGELLKLINKNISSDLVKYACNYINDCRDLKNSKTTEIIKIIIDCKQSYQARYCYLAGKDENILNNINCCNILYGISKAKSDCQAQYLYMVSVDEEIMKNNNYLAIINLFYEIEDSKKLSLSYDIICSDLDNNLIYQLILYISTTDNKSFKILSKLIEDDNYLDNTDINRIKEDIKAIKEQEKETYQNFIDLYKHEPNSIELLNDLEEITETTKVRIRV